MNKEKFNMEDYVNGLFQAIISVNQAGNEILKKQKEKKMKTNQINPQKQKTFREMYPWEISENETSPKLLWVKKVTSVNKYRADKNTLRTDENNFNGPYINIDTPENWQEGDVFLICSMSSYESKNRTFRVFQYMDGQLHSIVQMDETYDWPTLLFSTVEHLLEKK